MLELVPSGKIVFSGDDTDGDHEHDVDHDDYDADTDDADTDEDDYVYDDTNDDIAFHGNQNDEIIISIRLL